MASFEHALEDVATAIDENTICPVCKLECGTDARGLSCQHFLCLSCAEGLLKFTSNSENETLEENGICCPMCRQFTPIQEGADASSLPLAYYLQTLRDIKERLVSHTSQGKPPPEVPFCENCELKHKHRKAKYARFYCKNCDTKYCKECVSSHDQFSEQFKDHVKSIVDIKCEVPCGAHPKNISGKIKDATTFCKTCWCPVCSLCLMSRHGKHETEDLSLAVIDILEHISDTKEELYEQLCKENTIKEEICKLIHNVQPTRDEQYAKVIQVKEEAIDWLESQLTELNTEIEEASNEIYADLEGRKIHLDHLISEKKKLLEKLTYLTDKAAPVSILKLQKDELDVKGSKCGLPLKPRYPKFVSTLLVSLRNLSIGSILRQPTGNSEDESEIRPEYDDEYPYDFHTQTPSSEEEYFDPPILLIRPAVLPQPSRRPVTAERRIPALPPLPMPEEVIYDESDEEIYQDVGLLPAISNTSAQNNPFDTPYIQAEEVFYRSADVRKIYSIYPGQTIEVRDLKLINSPWCTVMTTNSRENPLMVGLAEDSESPNETFRPRAKVRGLGEGTLTDPWGICVTNDNKIAVVNKQKQIAIMDIEGNCYQTIRGPRFKRLFTIGSCPRTGLLAVSDWDDKVVLMIDPRANRVVRSFDDVQSIANSDQNYDLRDRSVYGNLPWWPTYISSGNLRGSDIIGVVDEANMSAKIFDVEGNLLKELIYSMTDNMSGGRDRRSWAPNCISVDSVGGVWMMDPQAQTVSRFCGKEYDNWTEILHIGAMTGKNWNALDFQDEHLAVDTSYNFSTNRIDVYRAGSCGGEDRRRPPPLPTRPPPQAPPRILIQPQLRGRYRPIPSPIQQPPLPTRRSNLRITGRLSSFLSSFRNDSQAN